MTDKIFYFKEAENSYWPAIVFLICLAIIALVKSKHEKRFSDFLSLTFSENYTQSDSSNYFFNLFMILLFVIQLFSYSFFSHLILHHYLHVSMDNWMIFIQIFIVFLYVILAKYIIVTIIGEIFDTETLLEKFELNKANYRFYIAVFLLPINAILYYNDTLQSYVLPVISFVVLILFFLTYIIILKKIIRQILDNLFYFILYLCTLEIAPYFLIYYLLKNSGF